MAASDPDGILATPVETVRRDRDRTSTAAAGRSWSTRSGGGGGGRAAAYPGRPHRPLRADAIDVAEALAGRIAPTPVRLADERLTTVTAQRSLREAGVRAKGQRAMIDQAAAVGILQTWLDQRRAVLAAHGEVSMPDDWGRERARAGGGRTAAARDEPHRAGPRRPQPAPAAHLTGFSVAAAGRRVVGAVFLGSGCGTACSAPERLRG